MDDGRGGDDVGFWRFLPGFLGVLSSVRVVFPLASGGKSSTPVMPLAREDGGESPMEVSGSACWLCSSRFLVAWFVTIVFSSFRMSCMASSNESRRLCAVAAVRGDWSDVWDDAREALVDCLERVDRDSFDVAIEFSEVTAKAS